MAELCWGPMTRLGRGCFWELASPMWEAADASAVNAIDLRADGAARPKLARIVSDPRLGGAADLCAAGGRGKAQEEAGKPRGGGATLFAVVPGTAETRLVVLKDEGETAVETTGSDGEL